MVSFTSPSGFVEYGINILHKSVVCANKKQTFSPTYSAFRARARPKNIRIIKRERERERERERWAN